MLVNLVLMTCHDYLFYASRDYDSMAQPSNIIGNYALMYAINRGIPEIRRLASGNVPHYDEDLPRMQVYATPAAFVDDFPSSGRSCQWFAQQLQLGGTKKTRWHANPLVMITWNSTGASLLDKMQQNNLNVPKKGAYYKYPPLRSFYFYAVGTPIPSVIRIGKKYIPARLASEQVEMDFKSGIFKPTGPVTVADLPSETEILSGSILTIPPAPVLASSELEGEYLEGRDHSGTDHRIPVPTKAQYVKSWE